MYVAPLFMITHFISLGNELKPELDGVQGAHNSHFISLGNELKPERGDNIPVGARYFGNELKTEPPHLRRFFH